MMYIINDSFLIEPGFRVDAQCIEEALLATNLELLSLPPSLYRCIDYKTISSMVGALFCDAIATRSDGIVNPIEKGHPDLVPFSASSASEAQLRNYPVGLEVKSTVGNIVKGANLRAGEMRIKHLTGITWQAHHREVRELMGLVWDFWNSKDGFNYPGITGIFYSSELDIDDWGAISGTTGRNTKVSGMLKSGKDKMGKGWIAILSLHGYPKIFSYLLNTPLKATD